jgi:succinate dehydrogenase / fumarate reductase cytochrome b subunit
MVVHLVTNASLLNGIETFQRAVFLIHSLGKLLPLVEWGAIFFPLLFHGIIGVWIWTTGKSNVQHYQYTANRRYTWQRWTGMIALAYLMVHVFHLHGWFHFKFWLDAITNIGGGQFRPYNAASSLAIAMDGVVWPVFYLVGVLACVYHLANGLWTAGITWGVWVSPAAQKRASQLCLGFGLALSLISLSAWWAALKTDPVAARGIEDRMYNAGVESGMVIANEHKRGP